MDCHEPDGRGEFSRENMRKIPDLTKSQWQITRTDAQWLQVIRDGKGDMPAFQKKLPMFDIVALIALVREFQDGRLVVPEEPEGPEKGAPAVIGSRSLLAVAPETRESREKASPDPEKAKPSARTNLGGPVPQLASRVMSKPVDTRAVAARGDYKRFCVSCHGSDGRGSPSRAKTPEIPDLSTQAWQLRASDAHIRVIINEGKGKNMPGFRDRLDSAQVRNLVALVRSFGPAATVESTGGISTDFDRRQKQLQGELEKVKQQLQSMAPK
jgi:mono/diheme cytochrome c family protein